MTNNGNKFGKYADIVERNIFDGRSRYGRPIKKTAKVAYPIMYYISILSFVTLICWGIFS